MEKRILRYAMIVVIFFIGLSLGVDYQNRSNLQDSLDQFEDEITKPNNDFEPVNPSLNPNINNDVEHNLFTSLAKDGEYIIKKGLDLILDTSNNIFRFIFGIK
ncbi:MAG TPA: hypothetical protein VIK84_03855 [Haloplasmataceae bacterium]